MSIAVLIGVHDGLVLAADSASTLLIQATAQAAGVAANVYDNANKIFNLFKEKPIGCITYGAGSIGSSSIGTLIKDLRAKLANQNQQKVLNFDPDKYTMEQVAGIVADFVGAECQKQNAAARTQLSMGILIGGYSAEASLGETWLLEITQGVPAKPRIARAPDQAGVTWGGAGEVLQRIVLGYGTPIFDILASVAGPPPAGQPPTSSQQLRGQLLPLFESRLQAPLVFAPMPIQDAIDLGRFLVHAAEMFSRFLPGPQIVGGPIEIATITKHEGFKWISRKHYYDQSLNREPLHVIVDR